MISKFQPRTILKVMSIIVIVIVILIMVIQVTFKLPPFSISTSGGMQQFKSQEGHFSMLYPSRWIITENLVGNRNDPSTVALINAPQILSPGASVAIYRKVSYDSVVDVAKWGEQLDQRQQAYIEISTVEDALKGEEMLLREYTFQLAASPFQSNPIQQCLDDYRLYKRVGYILSFCVDANEYSQIKPIFQQMIDSFAYLD